MPKQVDHDQRRREIAAAVSHLAATRGLVGVSFREVAAEAGMSVSLVQHYFGSKQNLLISTVNIHSAAIGQRVLQRLADLDPQAQPLARVRAVAAAFLPTDDESRAAMLVYHGFAAAALTDAALRDADAFRNAFDLIGFIRDQLTLAEQAGQLSPDVDADTEGRGILALILGMSLTVLLDGATGSQAEAVLEAHFALLERKSGRTRK